MQKKNVLWCLEQEAEHCLPYFLLDWSCWVRWFTSGILATQEAEAGGWQAKEQDRQLSETLLKKKVKRGLEIWLNTRVFDLYVLGPGFHP